MPPRAGHHLSFSAIRWAARRRILPTSDRVSIDLLGLATGTYLVEVTRNDRREVRKLMVVER